MFKITETGFDGLRIVETSYFNDERGQFRKVFSKGEFSELGLDTDFREAYYSKSSKNVIRGMHFQTPPSDHAKVVYLIAGRIIDVCLDLRKKSNTYGRYFSIELSNVNPAYIFIPKGFAHGFVSLENDSIVHYMQTSCYEKSCDNGIRFDSFGFDWKLSNPILSQRDLAFPAFTDFCSPF